MKAFRFCSLIALAILMTTGLTACSSDDKEFVDNESVASYKGEVVKGISVTLTDFVSDKAETRTTYDAADGGVKVTWAAGDTIGIFPNVGGQVEFPIEAGTASNEARFDGGGWALKSNSTYAAYYPYSAKNSYYTNKTIQVDFTGQKQTANGKTSHLGQYDYQATSGVTTNSSGYLNFQFKHLGALMVFNLTVPKAGTYTSLTLTSTEKVFVTKAELDISGNEPMLKNASKSNTFTLKLGDIALEADNSVLTAYMMLAPTDLSQGSLELTIDGDRIFTTTLHGHNLEAGKQYTIEKAFVDDTPSPDEIINFADENVKAICIENWDTNKDGELSYEEAATVTDIGNKFYAKTKIKFFDEFHYFTGVTSVQENAFKSCIALESIVLPNSLQSTGLYMFDGCGKLKSITLPEGLRSIGSYTFNNCPALKEITLPSSLTSIGGYAFSGSSFTSIVIPEGAINIEWGAFEDCKNLISVILPKGVTSIGSFGGCSNLKSIVIPEGVTSIGGGAFYNCSSLTNIVIPEGVTSIDDYAFYECSSLTSIVIPEGVTSIGWRAFNGCSSLTNIEIPEGVTSISEEAFASCSCLTNMVIPRGVTSIGSWAFGSCSSLTSIVIPEGVTSIGDGAFGNCSSLNSIVVDENNEYYDSRNDCSAIIDTKSNTLVVGCASTVIPSSVTSIGNHAFDRCSSLTNIVLPESVTFIDGYAFYGCSSLTNIVIPEGVTSIGNAAFWDCSSLNSFTCLASNPPTCGNSTFYNMNGTIYVPASSMEAYKAADGWKRYEYQIQVIPE